MKKRKSSEEKSKEGIIGSDDNNDRDLLRPSLSGDGLTYRKVNLETGGSYNERSTNIFNCHSMWNNAKH